MTTQNDKDVVIKNAKMSECNKHRLWLSREWDGTKDQMGWVMLNPSTADAEEDDATIRKCMGFASQNGFGSIFVVNLFTFRATDPKELYQQGVELNHPDADSVISGMSARCSKIVMGWGANGARWDDRTFDVKYLLRETMVPVVHLGLTKHGHPKHPLYIPYDQSFIPWRLVRGHDLDLPKEKG